MSEVSLEGIKEHFQEIFLMRLCNSGRGQSIPQLFAAIDDSRNRAQGVRQGIRRMLQSAKHCVDNCFVECHPPLDCLDLYEQIAIDVRVVPGAPERSNWENPSE